MRTYVGDMVLKRWKDPGVRNFGLGSRCPKKAALNFAQFYYKSFSSGRQVAARFGLFWDWLITVEPLIRDLRDVTKTHVEQYAAHLSSLTVCGALAAASAQNYLSAINVVLSGIRGDNECFVSPVGDALLPKRNHVCKESKAIDTYSLQAFISSLPLQIQVLAFLQVVFGLRFEESAKADVKSWLKQAIKNGAFQIVAGTKGGRRRAFKITNPDQIALLRSASKQQGSHHSLIPKGQSYAKFRRRVYRQLPDLATRVRFHQLRHTYAQKRYLDITNFPCPVATSLSKHKHKVVITADRNLTDAEYQELDRSARQTIATELGHNRFSISSAYVG